MKLIAEILFFVGFLVLFFILGAYESGKISDLQFAISALLTLIGIMVCGSIAGMTDIKDEIERRKK